MQGDPEPLGHGRHLGADVSVDPSEHVIQQLDDRDLDTDAGHHEGELHADHPAADDDQVPGELACLEHLDVAVGQLDAVDRQAGKPRPGRHHDRPVLEEPVADGERVRVDEAAGAGDEDRPAFDQFLGLGVATSGHDRLGPVNGGGPVDLRLTDGDTELGGPADQALACN